LAFRRVVSQGRDFWHTDGDTWIYFDDANVLDTGDTFTNTGRYNTIDFDNGGDDIRGLIRAVERLSQGGKRRGVRPWPPLTLVICSLLSRPPLNSTA
jgi:glyoxylase-like metal-dependent hydrolase (beta-lactamase superfamily II)